MMNMKLKEVSEAEWKKNSGEGYQVLKKYMWDNYAAGWTIESIKIFKYLTKIQYLTKIHDTDLELNDDEILEIIKKHKDVSKDEDDEDYKSEYYNCVEE